MSVSLTINGVAYSFPQTADENWGDNVTDWASAVTSGMLQKAGGTFTLTAEVDFGATFGLKSAYVKSRATNPASAGIVRLGNAETVSWRNNANSSDLSLTVNASDQLTFNGTQLQSVISVADTSTIDLTLTGAQITADIVAGSITNSHINAAAAIAYSKLALTASIVNADIAAGAAIARSKIASGTASHVLINDGSGVLSSEAQLAVSRGGTGQDFSASTGVLKVSAGTVSAGSIVNTDVDASAAIVYSKLNLTGGIVNADVNASAAIARSKIATGTTNRLVVNDGATGALSDAAAITAARVLISDANGIPTHSTVTTTTLGYLDATSSIQTQIDAKASTASLTSHTSDTSNPHSVTAAQVGNSTAQWNADKLQGVDVSASAPSTNDVLKYNGSAWAPASLGSANLTVASKTTNYTLTSSDDVILADASGGAFTLTLPASASNSGKVFRIKKTDSSTNAVTIDGNAAETIDGATTFTLTGQYSEVTLLMDGTNIQIMELALRDVRAATASTFTPTGNNLYHDLTGANISLPPGTWEVTGGVKFGASGTPSYTFVYAIWAEANGGNSGSPPTALGTNFTILGAAPTAGGGSGAAYGLDSTLSVNNYGFQLPPVVVSTTSTRTIYLVSYATLSTAADARVDARLYARRIR